LSIIHGLCSCNGHDMKNKRIVCMQDRHVLDADWCACLSESQGWTSASFRVCRPPCATSCAQPIKSEPPTSLRTVPIKCNCNPLLVREPGASNSLVCTAIVLLSIYCVSRSIVAACCHGPLVPLLPPLARLRILRDDRAQGRKPLPQQKLAPNLQHATGS
jgi:hypothetical protein